MATADLLYFLFEEAAAVDIGLPLNDGDHALQAATRAERDGADDELVVAALFHDVGRVVDRDRHGALSASLLAPHVRAEVEYALRVHQSFTAAHRDGRFAPQRLRHRASPHYGLAARFVDEWDGPARDPDYEAEPLEHFAPAVTRVLAQRYPPRYPFHRRVRGYALGRARAVLRITTDR